MKLYEVI